MTTIPPWEKAKKKRPASGPSAKSDSSGNTKRLENRTEENLSESAKLKRDRFIVEYLKDFNQTRAATRAGFAARSAAKKGSELIREPYVQQKIQEKLDELEEDAIVTRKHVMVGLVREANLEGRGSVHIARVNAWGKLAKILGMEIQKTENTHRISGVMEVPMAKSIAEWEGYATGSQQQLKDEVRK